HRRPGDEDELGGAVRAGRSCVVVGSRRLVAVGDDIGCWRPAALVFSVGGRRNRYWRLRGRVLRYERSGAGVLSHGYATHLLLLGPVIAAAGDERSRIALQ